MKSVPSAVADGLDAQLEVDREFILSPAKAGLGIPKGRDPRVTLAHPGLLSVVATRLVDADIRIEFKLGEQHEIRGLTTAASVWLTAAIGVTVGLGSLGIGLMVTALALITLSLERFEHHHVETEQKKTVDEPKKSR